MFPVKQRQIVKLISFVSKKWPLYLILAIIAHLFQARIINALLSARKCPATCCSF